MQVCKVGFALVGCMVTTITSSASRAAVGHAVVIVHYAHALCQVSLCTSYVLIHAILSSTVLNTLQ